MAGDGFYESLPTFAAFASLTNPDRYRPLPADWIVGIADVVGSGRAIAAGQYKAVNTVGAAVIAAVTNALPDLAFPFAFDGDGASLTTPGAYADVIADTLARTAAWSEDALGLDMRVAVFPIGEIRNAGVDVRVARYEVGRGVSYAMFSGGGLAWAEERLKAGTFRLPRAAPGATPDLNGLTCGFATIGTSRGTVLSIIVQPRSDPATFSRLIDDLLALVEGGDADGPLPRRVADPAFADTLVASAISRAQSATGVKASAPTAKPGAPTVGDGPPVIKNVVHDTDFRKFGDGLKMTIDCEFAVADAIERLLCDAQAAGVCHFGAHRQVSANLTCLLPPKQSRHAHFIDGADGGYATAAANLKAATRQTAAGAAA